MMVKKINSQAVKSEMAKIWSAFKTFAIIFSFIVNFVLVIVLLLSPDPIFSTKREIAEPLLLDLDSAFAALGDTTIRTTVQINHILPISFDLPLQQQTSVILNEAVPLQVPATFYLPSGGGSINGVVSLALPSGQALPVTLDLTIPVESTIPVAFSLPVEIELYDAGMGPAIDQLRAVFAPMTSFIQDLPDSPQEALRRDE
ncbi:MAG: hypothetical protein P1S60_12305 [Anaerolineae bacterium]|nr:hypothetical protein [Anaerolineae bacterium]